MSPLLLAVLLAQADPGAARRPPKPPAADQGALPEQPPRERTDPPAPTSRERPAPPSDEEVIRNLELLERLEFLRHAELFDDGDVSEPAPKPPPRPR